MCVTRIFICFFVILSFNITVVTWNTTIRKIQFHYLPPNGYLTNRHLLNFSIIFTKRGPLEKMRKIEWRKIVLTSPISRETVFFNQHNLIRYRFHQKIR